MTTLTEGVTIRDEATQMLSSGLLAILSEYGEVHVIGSYLLDLMVWRDLDIHLVRWPMAKTEFFTLGARVAELLKPQRMQYRDETVGTTPGLPTGLYWGIYLGDERKGAWKIDIWVTDAAGFEATRAYCEALEKRLDKASREAILRIKAVCWQHPEYRRGFSSVDIYSAVLEHEVVDIEGFWAFLKTRNEAV